MELKNVKRPIFHSEILQQKFMKDGYVTVKLQDLTVLKQILSEMRQLSPADNFEPYEDRKGNLINFHVTIFDADRDYRKQTLDLLRHHLTAELEKLLINYNLFSSNFFIKNPHCGTTEMHQHWTIADYQHTTLNCWIPLQDVDENNGTIQIVEGSQKIIPYTVSTSQHEYFDGFKNELARHLKAIPLQFGEALIFCETIAHGSLPNASEAARLALQLSLYPAECEPYVVVDNESTGEHDRYIFDENFYLDMFDHTTITIPSGAKKIDSVPNTNYSYTYEEFLFRMSEGPRIREQLYSGQIPVVKSFMPKTYKTAIPVSGNSAANKIAMGLYSKLKVIINRGKH